MYSNLYIIYKCVYNCIINEVPSWPVRDRSEFGLGKGWGLPR